MNLAFIYPRSSNLGDDIQTLAALQFMPNAAFVDRDKLSTIRLDGKVILNGWWTHDPINAFPPRDNLDCLAISMHINQKARQQFEKEKQWFEGRKVLARDQDTNDFLKSIGVDSEFGGCLTLTLPRNEPKTRTGFYIVDAPDVKIHGIRMTHKTVTIHSHQKRRKDAQALLDTYQGAELVITKRLHCALPCAAMGTPVILIGNNPRFTGMDKFVTIVKTADQVEGAIEKAINFDRTDIEKYADRLTKTVQEWLT
jgi:hypothetical protein